MENPRRATITAPLPPQRQMTVIAQDPAVRKEKKKDGKILMATIAVLL